MKVSEEITNASSEEKFASTIHTLSDAGVGVVHVRTSELVRTVAALRRTVVVSGGMYEEWDIINGFRKFDATNMFNHSVKGDGDIDLNGAMAKPGLIALEKGGQDQDTDKYFVYVHPHPWMENSPAIQQHLQYYNHFLSSSYIRVIVITPDMPLPGILVDEILSIKMDTPSFSELRGYLSGIVERLEPGLAEIEDDELDHICYAASGMTKEAFEKYVALAIVNKATESSEGDNVVHAEDVVSGVNEGKTEIVNRNDILELNSTSSMDEVGGMDNLKEWVSMRSNCYSDEAAEFGVTPPKGMVFVGLPGTGKSLAAKAIANVLGIPLVRLDFGRVFNSFVGKSEERMRTALSMVESMSPCVLFCDEIDKGLGGSGGTGDSGTSSRVLGSFLTWLQENTTPVFTMVTANNITGLPPELLRRGRFDAIFSTGFPTKGEYREILGIHLRKRGRSIKDFTTAEINMVIQSCKGYLPAELESAIKDALVNAFSSEEDLAVEHIIEALKAMVPLSVTYADRIREMTVWMSQNATPASKTYDDTVELGGSNVASIGGRIRTRSRRTIEDTTED